MTASFVVAMTGGSGAVYGVRLLQVLLSNGCDVHLCLSEAGRAVLAHELNLHVDPRSFELDAILPPAERLENDSDLALLRDVLQEPGTGGFSVPARVGKLHFHAIGDWMAPIASGSHLTAGMVICPCSGGTLSAVAHGSCTNLIHRAADVHLKERRKLVLVPREMPLSLIHLNNMRRCVEAGAVVLPAMPGWYHGVRSLRDLVDFVVARICDQLGIPQALMARWGQ